MIDRVLPIVARRAGAGDALWRRTVHTGVSFESGRLKAAGTSERAGLNVRVICGGRVGVAGTTAGAAADLDALVARAVASAELGETVALEFPRAAALPDVRTADDRAERAGLDELIRLGRSLVERLARDGCQVNVAVEREIADTDVGGTGGARGEYHATGVAVAAELTRVTADDVLMVGDGWSGAGLPATEDLDALVRGIDARFRAALAIVPPPTGALPVVFTPAGLAALLLPVEEALSGKAVLQGVSPLADKVGRQVFDAAFSIVDDPLAAGRPASRPVDDEGVPSARLELVTGGVVRAFAYDLETAARAGTRSTGHGHRGTFGKPHDGFTNLIVGSRAAAAPGGAVLGGGLVRGLATGLVVDELIGVGQGNTIGGVFSHPVALAYRVENGEVTGRVKDAAVAGNAYELLQRVAGFGNDGRWVGTRWSPSLLIEGVNVAGR